MRLSVENLDFGFGGRRIFKGLSLDLSGGDPVVILGASGCGKTTLLRLIAGLLRPEAGRITVENAPVSSQAALQIATTGVCEAHRRVLSRKLRKQAEKRLATASFVFQEDRLLPYLNALENVMLPIVKPLGRAEAEERARFFLHESAIHDYAEAYPDQLSGGQRQRVSIARAWAYPAPIILMDEPFHSLDIPLRTQLMDSVLKLKRAEDRFVVAVTHEPREAAYLGRRIIILGGGAGRPSMVIFDEKFEASLETGTPRGFVSEVALSLEQKLCETLSCRP
jgi:ABC-type nitrate/sulfonate/bicarbonate transport system ATPase subunit